MRTGDIQGFSGELLKTAICEGTARVCLAHFGPTLRAIVLTGSLARDEGTFVEDGPHSRLLGDADFFVIFQDRARLPGAREIEFAAQDLKNDLRQSGLTASVGLAAVQGSYFRKLPRHIATYELRSYGRVVWGAADILSLVPAFEPEQISLEDAWRMLANRIIELLEVLATDEQSGEAHYRTIKLFLDMATSYLVFASRYHPTYRDRERVLSSMANDGPAQAGAPFPLRRFADRVSECTRFKLDGSAIASAPKALLEDAVHFAHLLWRWELRILLGGAEETSDSELMSSWMARQPLKARIRGWASVLRRSGWHRSWREWPRWIWLGRRASPRYWVYSVAADAFFRLNTDEIQDSASQREMIWELIGKLPLLKAAEQDSAAADWKRLMNVTALNYRRLLEATTA